MNPDEALFPVKTDQELTPSPSGPDSRAMAWVFVVLVVAAAFLMALRPVRSPDVWHHVKSGWFVIENRGPAKTDPFSCTAEGKRWIQYEWLAQVTIYGIYRTTGIPGLVLFRALGVALTALLLLLACRERKGVAWPAAAIAVMLAMCAASGRFFTRPEILTWIFLAGWLLSVERIRRGRHAFWIAPALLMIPWVNSHGAWPAGLAWLGLICGGETIRRFLRRPDALPDRTLVALWAALALALPATLVNPYGLHIWEVPFKLAQMPEVRASIAEWQRPDMGHWLYPPHIGVWVLLLALVLAPRSVTLPDLMVVLFFGGLSLTANRHLAIGMLVAAPILARQLTALWTMAASRLTRLSAWERPAATAALTTAISALLVWLSLGLTLERAGIGMERSRYPIGAAKFLNGHRLAGNLFNSYTYGNYLLFACYPQNRVFIDGRVDMYGGGVVGLYDIVRRAAPGWADCLRKYAVDICVLGASATEGRLMDGLHASPEWALVYWDDISAVYLRRVPRYQAFLQSARIYTVRADQFDEAALSAADRRRQAEEEYRAKLNEDPDCAMALYGLARCLGARGAREEALGPLRRAIVVQPQNGTLHYALGTFLMELGRLDEAEAAYHQALRLCPGQSEPYLAMSVIAHRRGRLDEAIADCRNALKYSPKNWKISWNLSVLYEEKGDIANALAAARNVVALNPEMKAAVEKVNALQSKLKNAESPQP